MRGTIREKARKEFGSLAKDFAEYIHDRKGRLPEEFEECLLRDVLHYTTEDLENLTIEQYVVGLLYAETTYMRRDVVFALEKIFSGKRKNGRPTKGEYDFTINHPEVEKYIKANQIVDDPEINWGEIK